jgi:hypothetical protein
MHYRTCFEGEFVVLGCFKIIKAARLLLLNLQTVIQCKQSNQLILKYRFDPLNPLYKNSVVDTDALNLNQDPAFQVNPDPEPGFSWQEINEKKQMKIFLIFS